MPPSPAHGVMDLLDHFICLFVCLFVCYNILLHIWLVNTYVLVVELATVQTFAYKSPVPLKTCHLERNAQDALNALVSPLDQLSTHTETIYKNPKREQDFMHARDTGQFQSPHHTTPYLESITSISIFIQIIHEIHGDILRSCTTSEN